MPEVGCAGLLVEDTFCGPLRGVPQPGSLVVLEDMPARAGGCAANVAVNLAHQGVQADVMGCLGEDAAAEVVRSAFHKRGIGCTHLSTITGLSTSRTVILLVNGEDRRYLHSVGANQMFTLDHIPRHLLVGLKVFYLGGLFALPGINLIGLAELLAHCQSNGVTTVLDVVIPQDFSGMLQLKRLLPHVDVFVPNEDEARALTARSDPIEQLKDFADAGSNTVIITRGRLGSVSKCGERVFRCDAYPVDVADPSGSGDAFTAGVIRGLLNGWEFPHLLRYASAVGASVNRSIGTTDSVFSAKEAEDFIANHRLSVIEEVL